MSEAEIFLPDLAGGWDLAGAKVRLPRPTNCANAPWVLFGRLGIIASAGEDDKGQNGIFLTLWREETVCSTTRLGYTEQSETWAATGGDNMMEVHRKR